MDVRAYLSRIQVDPESKIVTEPTLEALRELHQQHLYAVPFENLDIHFGVPIVLDLDRILGKVVSGRRGGFCYELNGAFAWLLSELGYDVTMLSAEVARANGGYGIPFDHMTLRVDIDGTPWLADVGFGDNFLHPVPIDDQLAGEYRLTSDGEIWTLAHGDVAKYRFTLTPRRLEDYVAACHYQQTSEESTFTQRVVTTRATPGGRITLTRERLIRYRAGEKTETPIDDDCEWRRALEKHFGIHLEN